jgi:hypothetical protein
MPIGYWDSAANGGSGCYIESSSFSCTTLDSNGDGDWGSSTYVSGDLANGYYGSISNSAYSTGGYFISGSYTSLDSIGSGVWNGQAYYAGNAQATGWNGYYYYVDNQQTTLDEFGDGYWNGVTYDNGVPQILAVRFVGTFSGDWADVSNWTDAASTTATVMPDGSSSVTILSAVTTDNSYAASVANMTVDGTYVAVNVSVSSSAVFKNGAYLASGATLTGDAEFRDTSYMESGSAVTGDATFKGRSLNKNDISGNVTSAHGGGINGSNILGFA